MAERRWAEEVRSGLKRRGRSRDGDKRRRKRRSGGGFELAERITPRVVEAEGGRVRAPGPGDALIGPDEVKKEEDAVLAEVGRRAVVDGAGNAPGPPTTRYGPRPKLTWP